MKPLLALALLTLFSFTAQEAAPPAQQLEQHAWLQQFVGEWQVSSEAIMEPGGEPSVWESRESVRSVGEFWTVAESSAVYDGQPFTSLLTLGYDSDQKAFVGSWVDTIQTRMWTYVGQLDEAGRVLTLEAEGPSFFEAGKTAKYRDQHELLGPDHKRITSTVLADDGQWVTYLTADARRVK